jgi:hypothetical protein
MTGLLALSTDDLQPWRRNPPSGFDLSVVRSLASCLADRRLPAYPLHLLKPALRVAPATVVFGPANAR